MNHCFELKAQRGIDVRTGDYIETVILNDGDVLYGSEGRDEFRLSAMLMPGKRVAGFGRRKSYAANEMPAGLPPLEAAPSRAFDLSDLRNLAFRISTNILLDQGLLTHHLSLGIIRDGVPALDIPLDRPDVRIEWPSRGTFVIKVSQL